MIARNETRVFSHLESESNRRRTKNADENLRRN